MQCQNISPRRAQIPPTDASGSQHSFYGPATTGIPLRPARSGGPRLCSPVDSSHDTSHLSLLSSTARFGSESRLRTNPSRMHPGSRRRRAFRLANNRLPAHLAELVPAFLAGVPNDPITGAPLLYKPSPKGSFVIYGIGWNQADDGGAVNLPQIASPQKQADWGVSVSKR